MTPKYLNVYLERDKFTEQTYEKEMEEIQRLAENFERTIYLEPESVGCLFEQMTPEDCICITTSADLSWQLMGLGYAVVGFETDDSEMMKAPYVLLDLEEIEYDDLLKIYQRYYDIPWHILDTSRCTIREFGMDDLDQLEEMYAVPGFTEFIEPLYAHELEREYERNYIDNIYKFYGFGMWLVFHKESGRLIGRAGIEFRDNCDENEVELGYAILPEFRGQGIATEICTAIIDYVREELAMRSIICRVNVANDKSQKFIEKLGFTVRNQVDDLYTYEYWL